MISIINQGGEYMIAVYYNECDENGNITKRNAKAPVYYAVSEILDKVKELDVLIKNRLNESEQ